MTTAPPKIRDLSWKFIQGRELAERAERNDSVSDLVPAKAGVYIWQRSLTPPLGVMESRPAFSAWLKDLVSLPAVRVQGKQIEHFLHLRDVQVGGLALSVDKLDTLSRLARNEAGRLFVVRFLETLSSHLPSLYVGQSDDLQRRVMEHVSGRTGLCEKLKSVNLQIPDVVFRYFVVPEISQQEYAEPIRTLLEAIATGVTIAPMVNRVG